MSRHSQTIGIKMEGFRSLDSAIKRLPFDLQKAGYRAVIQSGAVPIRRAAKQFARASRDSGLLIKSLGIKSVVFSGGTPYAVIGSLRKVAAMVQRKGQSAPKLARPANYAHLVEFGTSHSAAKPYMRPAVDAAQDQVLDAMAKGLDRYLTRVVRRLKLRSK